MSSITPNMVQVGNYFANGALTANMSGQSSLQTGMWGTSASVAGPLAFGAHNVVDNLPGTSPFGASYTAASMTNPQTFAAGGQNPFSPIPGANYRPFNLNPQIESQLMQAGWQPPAQAAPQFGQAAQLGQVPQYGAPAVQTAPTTAPAADGNNLLSGFVDWLNARLQTNGTGPGGISSRQITPFGDYTTKIGPGGGIANVGLLGIQIAGDAIGMRRMVGNPGIILDYAGSGYTNTNFLQQGQFFSV
ncbi:MAG: hypothetical protein VKJ06_04385 [Vampirovibrionales bacterium]|nr:hypothetical protein [Vampirovibrionales bacterium]